MFIEWIEPSSNYTFDWHLSINQIIQQSLDGSLNKYFTISKSPRSFLLPRNKAHWCSIHWISCCVHMSVFSFGISSHYVVQDGLEFISNQVRLWTLDLYAPSSTVLGLPNPALPEYLVVLIIYSDELRGFSSEAIWYFLPPYLLSFLIFK